MTGPERPGWFQRVRARLSGAELPMWRSQNDDVYEPPADAEPYEPGDDDDVPWELRDPR